MLHKLKRTAPQTILKIFSCLQYTSQSQNFFSRTLYVNTTLVLDVSMLALDPLKPEPFHRATVKTKTMKITSLLPRLVIHRTGSIIKCTLILYTWKFQRASYYSKFIVRALTLFHPARYHWKAEFKSFPTVYNMPIL